MIAKDGYPIILITGLMLILFIILAVVFQWKSLWFISILVAIVFIFHFFFFRDPEREITLGENLILSPADGTVIKVDQVYEPIYMKEQARRVSIFMSVFNVHINRMPAEGQVEFVQHQPGKFLIASQDDASDNNEQTAIGLKTAGGKILFKQIAGLIARRIVCRAKEGDAVKAGQRFGMIKYSSRVDIFLPLSVKVQVKVNDKVKGGLSIIGEF